MKISTVFLTISACATAAMASPAPASNTTARDAVTVPSNSTRNSTSTHGASIQQHQMYDCDPPAGGARPFWRLTKSNGPYYECTVAPLDRDWSMLKSYRDGGVQGVHWKYTDNENDPECMQGWNYHAADGRTLKTYVSGRTTTYGLNRRWCGLPVYHDGGVEGYQWGYCSCRWYYWD